MQFIPTHKTKDDLFLIDFDSSGFNKEDVKALGFQPFWVSKNITNTEIQTYNTKTNMLSSKGLYIGKQQRLYFNGAYWGKTKRYYIDELVKVKE